MTVVGYRIYKAKNAARAFTGDGARSNGGRWNSEGIAAVYTAGSQALAALEMLVHLSSEEVLHAYEVRAVTIDVALIEQLDPVTLPPDWQADPAPVDLRVRGDNWALELRSAVLRVPSAIVPSEHNYLLNPAHPDFDKIVIGPAGSFAFDPRLIKAK